MATGPDNRRTHPPRQQGVAAVEFALVAIVFFTLLLGIIEFGRLLYMWNTVQEVTRRAAREAVVSPFSDKATIQHDAIFGASSLAAAPEITSARVVIKYLNTPTGSPVTPPDNPQQNMLLCEAEDPGCVRFVAVSVCMVDEYPCQPADRVSYEPMVGLFPYLAVPIPDSTVIMPAESLGYTP